VNQPCVGPPVRKETAVHTQVDTPEVTSLGLFPTIAQLLKKRELWQCVEKEERRKVRPPLFHELIHEKIGGEFLLMSKIMVTTGNCLMFSLFLDLEFVATCHFLFIQQVAKLMVKDFLSYSVNFPVLYLISLIMES